MKSSGLVVLGFRVLAVWVLVSMAICETNAANTASDVIFANGLEPIGYAIPLAAPDGPDSIYTTQVTVGNQNFAMLVDTASTTLAVAGIGCTAAMGCVGVLPLYAPSSSATATGNTASSTYGDGSGWSGTVFSDTVGLGNGSPPVSLDLAKITQANSFFEPNNIYQGILGLGPPDLAVTNTNGYVPALVGAGVSNIFAFELCDSTGANAGTMWLGGDGSAASAQHTPLLPIDISSSPFYAINVNAMSLGSTSIVTNASSIFEQPILDTGTSLFYLPSSVYNTFVEDLVTSTQFNTVFGNNAFSFSNNCVHDTSVTDAQVQSGLPPIVLSLPNVTSGQPDVTIQAPALDTYMQNYGGGNYCLTIYNGGTQNPSVFGQAFLQAFHVVIDVTHSRVGFSPQASCVKPALRRILHPDVNGPHRSPRFGSP